MPDNKSSLSSLLKYSGEYLGMSVDERFDNVRSLEEAEAHPVLKNVDMDGFCLETLKDLYDIPDFEFYNFGEPCYREVHKRFIVGTAHDAYTGKNWLTALTCLQKDCCKTEEEIVNFISFENRFRRLIELAQFGDEYYITNGNSRIIQAQFAPSISVIPCMVTEFVFDERRFEIASEIEAAGAILDHPGHHRIGHEVTVRYEGVPIGISFDEQGLEHLKSAIMQIRKRRDNRRCRSLFSSLCSFLLIAKR